MSSVSARISDTLLGAEKVRSKPCTLFSVNSRPVAAVGGSAVIEPDAGSVGVGVTTVKGRAGEAGRVPR